MGTGKQHALVGKLLKTIRKIYKKNRLENKSLSAACENICCFLSLSGVSSPITLHLLSLVAPGTPRPRQGDSPSKAAPPTDTQLGLIYFSGARTGPSPSGLLSALGTGYICLCQCGRAG